MFCMNCGKEAEEGEKYCGKCGAKLGTQKEPIRIKLKYLIIGIIVIAVLVGGILAYLNRNDIIELFSSKDVNEEYIEEILITGPSGSYFVEGTTRILGKVDLFYENYDKLVIYTTTVRGNSENSANGIGIMLVNKEKDIFYSIEINNSLYSVLYGLYGNGDVTKIEKLAPIYAKYIQNYGPDVCSYGNDGHSDLCKEIANIVGVEKARKYINDDIQSSNTSNLNATVLYEKNSIEAKYIAFYQQTTKYNWPVEENIAEYWYKTNRDTYYNMELIYGPAYSVVYEYEIMSMKTAETVGTYSSLEKAKSSLNVEE